MDKETFTNHIASLGKRDFEIACRIVLNKVFHLCAVNVDGSYDGGSDFVSIDDFGGRTIVAYQITTQKSDIKNKAYNDAKKSISKLGAKKYFFFCTYKLSEEEARRIENEIEDTLDVRSNVYYPSIIAGLLINNDLVTTFLDETSYPNLRANPKQSVDYRQRVLHCYTILSSDAKNLKEQIYDDSIMLAMSEYPDGLSKEDIVAKTIDILRISAIQEEKLSGRIDSLLSKSKIRKIDSDCFALSDKVMEDIVGRQKIYERELELLASAQADILHDFHIEWSLDDARQVSCWIANICLERQIAVLKNVDAPLSKNFGNTFKNGGRNELKKFLLKNKKVPTDSVDKIIDRFLSVASDQPIIKKISRACVYIALEGKNPISSCRALGVSRWSDFNMLIEPTIGIPLLCSYLFSGKMGRNASRAIHSVALAEELGINRYIPYIYIKECAGHLHMARKYNDIQLNPAEMIYSNNAFVAHYYSLLRQGIELPATYLEYLSMFSSNILIEKEYKEWIKSLMTDIQSLFTRTGNVQYLSIPEYESSEIEIIDKTYSEYLEEKGIDKPAKLLKNDVIALKFIDDMALKGENWLLPTYDSSLIAVAKQTSNHGWVTTPYNFLDMADISKPLDEKEMTSLIHSVAHYSESTLSIGARIIDKIVYYASDKMQNWQFQKELAQFKEEMLKNTSIQSKDYLTEIDSRTDEFLSKHGIKIQNDDENDADIENDATE